MTNSQIKQQHEKCACIITMSIKAKARANKYLIEVNQLVARGVTNNAVGESIWQLRASHRQWMQVYERLKRYYHKQLEKLVGDDYVHINSLATL